MKKSIIYPFIFIIIITTFKLTSYASEQSELSFSLPNDISNTDFNSSEEYIASKNGMKTSFLGKPFLKNNACYIPIRDLANAFNVNISYTPDDRIVILSKNNKMIIISPERIFEKKGTVIISKNSNKNDYLSSEQTYILKNNRSYVPLRFVMETLDYNVDYDDKNKIIRISNKTNEKIEDNIILSEEQNLIITSIAKFENEKEIHLSGSTSLLGEEQKIQADISKFNKNNSMLENIKIIADDGEYFANKEMFPNDSAITYSLARITDSGLKEPISLKIWASNHPYFHLLNTGISGIEKYKINDIKKLAFDGKIQKFSISSLNTDEFIEIGIDIEEKRLVTYTYKSSKKNIFNEFTIEY